MLRLLLFVSLVVLVYLAMQYYVAFWIIRNFTGLRPWANIIRLVILVIALCFPLSMVVLRNSHGPLAYAFAAASFLWVGVVVIGLGWAAIGDALVLLARWAGHADRLRGPVAAAVIGLTVCSCIYAFWNAARMPVVREVEVPVKGLPAALDGFAIVQLSDIHIGVTVPMTKFERIVKVVAGLEPDLVVMTGDLMDPGVGEKDEVVRIGQGLRGRCGFLAVMGNHEFYHGLERSLDVHRGMGARILRNEVVKLPCGVQVAGVDDIRTTGLSAAQVEDVLLGLESGKPSIFLSHQPLYFAEAARAGVDLMLSGHTHGGQLFPFTIAVRLSYRYVSGLYRKGDSWLYVSPGTGQWGPTMRLFTRAEIVRLTLRPAP